MGRRLVLVLCLLASGLIFGGWVVVKSGPSSGQADVGGPVKITFVACLSGSAVSTCPATGTSEITQPTPDGQVLVGFRIPAGAEGPSTFATTAGVALTFSESSSYAAELQRLLPAPGDQRWIGYVSQTARVPNASEATVAVDIELPPDHPFVGPFKVRPVVGARAVAAGAPADRPVACGANPYAVFPATGPERTVCVDSPTAALVGTDVFYYATRDFGVVAGNATASPGQTVSLPFGVRGAGALPAGLTAALSASTSLPGATVAPSAPSAPLSNGSDTRVTVPVAIPAGAAAGTYEVVLTGRLENGQERRGVAGLTVRARPEAPNVAPVVSALRVRPKTFKPASRRKPKRGTSVAYALSEAARVRVVVERCAKYAKPKGKRRAKRALADAAASGGKRKPAVESGRCLRFAAMGGAQTRSGKAGANGFRFNGKVAGRALRPGAYRLALTPTDAAGARGRTVRAPFTIAR